MKAILIALLALGACTPARQPHCCTITLSPSQLNLVGTALGRLQQEIAETVNAIQAQLPDR